METSILQLGTLALQGIDIDNNLNWNTDVQKNLYLILIINRFENALLILRKLLVQALVIPHFHYCDSLQTIHKLECKFRETEILQIKTKGKKLVLMRRNVG